MKIEKKFAPVTITFETEEEFQTFKEIIGRASKLKGHFYDILRDSLEEKALHLYQQLK